MKKNLLFSFLLCLPFLAFGQSDTDKITFELLMRMQAEPDARQAVIIQLADQIDTEEMLVEFETSRLPLDERAYLVVTRLQEKAAQTQPQVIAKLERLQGIDQATMIPLWITNAVLAYASPDAIRTIAAWPEIGVIEWHAPTEIDQVVKKESAAPTPNGTEPGLRAIKAPFMWNLGYTGYGRKALVLDSGEDLEHPALMDKWWGHQVPKGLAWKGSGYPEDCGEHGSHVTGTVLGLDRRTNDTIGVAFNAHWMGGPIEFDIGADEGCLKGFDQFVYSPLLYLQWALNPDSNAQTTNDIPDVINCSISSGTFGCNSNTSTLNACEAAGIPIVWSAGNNGPGTGTICCAQTYNISLVNSFSVGAVNGANPNFPITGFSSRGPSQCSGSGPLAIKPEVVAPGQSVRSSVPTGNGYANFDGTSMAAPHVSGAILLLKEAFPTLSGTELKLALYNSAKDLGVVGEDNTYGRGIIDLEAAYNYLLGQGHVPVPPVPRDRDVVLINALVNGICKGNINASVIVENAGAQTLNSLTIDYGVENGAQASYTWNGTLAVNAFTTIELPPLGGVTPGTYTFIATLSNPNGQTDERNLNNQFKRRFTMYNEDYATAEITAAQPAPVCQDSRVLLEYTGALGPAEQVQWFTSPSGTQPTHVGNSFLTPPLSSNTTYYVAPSEFYQAGKAAPTGNTGENIEGGLVFSASRPLILRSVKVYANTTGGRLIQLLDGNGTQIAFKLVPISQTGEQRISLNFLVPEGTNYVLRLSGGQPLQFNSSAPGFPHAIANTINIYSGRTPTGVNTSFIYYYFFDWEVEVPLICGRTPVTVEVGPSAAHTVFFTASADTVYLSQGGMLSLDDITNDVSSREWDFGNGQTSTDKAPSVTYTSTGTYTVQLRNSTSGGCTNFAQKDIVVLEMPTVSTKAPFASDQSVLLFPNPANDEVFIAFEKNIPDNLDVTVFDLLGRPVQFRAPSSLVDGMVRLNTALLADGVYMVHLSSNGTPYWTGKFVKK